ncbi:MAG: helix-turn-helix transcriptional regulator [Acidobacteria bacterium]|nr:helix-turn-helix transcriptional regulator [Acidobacteriota bacterium]
MTAYREWTPPSDLSPLIECLWTRSDNGGRGSATILPDGCIDLIIDTLSGEAFLVGTMTRPLEVEAARRDLTAIRFRPGGATSFFSFSARGVVDQRLPLDSIWRASEVADLIDKLSDRDLPRRLDLLMSTLRHREKTRPGADRVLAAAQLLRSLTVEQTASALGLSRQHLSRLSLEHVGVSPKRLARILRFRDATTAIRRGSSPLVDLALAAGYADQSHMNRDFREFAGTAASRFLS